MRAFLLAGALSLGGCAALPPPTSGEGASGIALRARSATDPAFMLAGRFVVKGPEQTASAALDWQHSTARDELRVNGPLGKVLAELVRDEAGVRLTDDRQRVTEAATLDELSRAVFGADLPLSSAAFWVTGRAGSADVRARDAQGRIAVLSDRLWRVEFTEYDGDGPDALPRQIEASDGEHSFRLRIDEWQQVP